MKINYFHDLNGERKDQLLVVVDKNGKKLGVSTREECHKGEGKTHLAFMAFVIDLGCNIILAKRSKAKSLWSGFWDASVVSHVLPGETIEEAAKRRGKEELGAEVDFKTVGAFYYFASHGKSSENEYCYVLIGKSDKKICPNLLEIDKIKTLSLQELKINIRENPDEFTPWLKIAMEKIDTSNFL